MGRAHEKGGAVAKNLGWLVLGIVALVVIGWLVISLLGALIKILFYLLVGALVVGGVVYLVGKARRGVGDN
jgi:predicted membrane channel-forming protein YqfA (hemolysin III family)